MPEKASEIVVIGGGPAGLSAALFLARLGLEPTLVAPAPPPDRRTSALLAGSADFLKRLGVWDLVAAAATPMTAIRLVDATTRLIRAPEVLFRSDEVGLEAFGYNIPNAALTEALDAALGQSSVARRETMVTALHPGPERVELELADGERLTARVIIAADGSNSAARDAAGIAVRRWRYNQSALVANLGHEFPHDQISTEFHTDHGPTTLVPLDGLRSSLVLVDRRSEVDRLVELTDADFADALEARVQSFLGRFTVAGRRQVFPLGGLTAERFAARRTVLVGEAGHVMPPIGAQGLNLGLRDVAGLEVLASAAARRDPGQASVLAAYDRARRSDITARSAAVDLLNRTLLTGFLPVQLARGLGLFLLDRVGPLRRAVMRQGIAPDAPGAG